MVYIFNAKGMMTKDKILKEQLLEQYLIGDLEPAVSDQVELALSKDPSLKAIFNDMELDFEKLGQEQALSVPMGVKEQLMNEISKSKNSEKVRPLKQQRFKTWFSLAAAASVILFLNTIYLIVQNGDIKQELTEITSETEQLKEQQRSLITSYNNQESLLAFISNPNNTDLAKASSIDFFSSSFSVLARYHVFFCMSKIFGPLFTNSTNSPPPNCPRSRPISLEPKPVLSE